MSIKKRVDALRWWLAWRVMGNNDRIRVWFYFMFWIEVAHNLPRRLGNSWWKERNDRAWKDASKLRKDVPEHVSAEIARDM